MEIFGQNLVNLQHEQMGFTLILGLPTKQDWPQLLIECFAEIFGTFIIVFFGCGSVLSPAVQVSFQLIFMLNKETKKYFEGQ